MASKNTNNGDLTMTDNLELSLTLTPVAYDDSDLELAATVSESDLL